MQPYSGFLFLLALVFVFRTCPQTDTAAFKLVDASVGLVAFCRAKSEQRKDEGRPIAVLPGDLRREEPVFEDVSTRIGTCPTSG